MKKLICIFTALLCITAGAIPCLASPDVIFTVSASQEKGRNIVVDIKVSKDSSLYTTEFYILFDPTDVAFVRDSEKGGDIVAGLKPYITATEVEAGKIKVSYTSTKSLDTAGVLCQLEFRSKTDSFVRFDIEVEHAESFDGKEIYALTTQGVYGSVTAKKQTSVGVTVAVVAAGGAAVAAAAVLIAKKKKSR